MRLGFTSFGGPVAHLSYFHDELVKRRRWLDERVYADLVALCQFLPGPASSQVGIAIGLTRAGVAGAFAAWLGFTLPSAALLTLFALGLGEGAVTPWLHGLKLAAVAVVAQAVWAMGRKLCPDVPRALLAAVSTAAILLIPAAWFQLVVIFVGACVGLAFFRNAESLPPAPIGPPLSRRVGVTSGVLFFLLLALLPLLAAGNAPQALKLFDSFFRAGSLVFGGGHVVLPLLQAEVVPPGWVTKDIFLAGYGAAQAIPGPLFSFSAYLGAASRLPPNGFAGAALCLSAAFLPSFLLMFAVLPFWDTLRRMPHVRSAITGINAVVVGLLLSALVRPVGESALRSWTDAGIATALFLLLTRFRVPSWAVVILAAMAGKFLTV